MAHYKRGIKLGLFTLLALALAVLPACQFKAGVGGPAEAKVDKQLAGHWANESNGSVNVVVVKPRKDGKTYDIEYMAAKGTLNEPGKKQLRLAGQAWLATMEGKRFFTVKATTVNGKPGGENVKPYMVFALERKGKSFSLAPLSDNLPAFQQAATRAEMERALRENLQEPKAYQDAATFDRTTAAAAKKVAELF